MLEEKMILLEIELKVNSGRYKRKIFMDASYVIKTLYNMIASEKMEL